MKKIAIRALLVLLGLPILLIAVAVSSFYAIFYFPNRTTARMHTIAVSGEPREYLLYVPPSYDRTKPAPLVISLHPAMSWPAAQMTFSQWNRVADANGAVVAYPAGPGAGPKVWLMRGRGTPRQMPDVVFISRMIDEIEASYAIDKARVYADGLSNGGGMAFVLSCTLSDRVAAVGLVSAARSPDFAWCADDRPVPAIAFHGTADPIVPYAGGPTPVGPDIFPSVTTFTAQWARRNRCAADPIDTAPAADIVRREYTGCAANASVVLYTVDGGGHQWPGGHPLPSLLAGRYSGSVDATQLIWTFFRDHPLAASLR